MKAIIVALAHPSAHRGGCSPCAAEISIRDPRVSHEIEDGIEDILQVCIDDKLSLMNVGHAKIGKGIESKMASSRWYTYVTTFVTASKISTNLTSFVKS